MTPDFDKLLSSWLHLWHKRSTSPHPNFDFFELGMNYLRELKTEGIITQEQYDNLVVLFTERFIEQEAEDSIYDVFDQRAILPYTPKL